MCVMYIYVAIDLHAFLNTFIYFPLLIAQSLVCNINFWNDIELCVISK